MWKNKIFNTFQLTFYVFVIQYPRYRAFFGRFRHHTFCVHFSHDILYGLIKLFFRILVLKSNHIFTLLPESRDMMYIISSIRSKRLAEGGCWAHVAPKPPLHNLQKDEASSSCDTDSP